MEGAGQPYESKRRPISTTTHLYFAITIFVGATLFFSCEPIVARMIVPLLGGAPSVWIVCSLMFQTLLLAGYGYAHFVGTKLPVRVQIAMQGVLIAAVFAVMPISVDEAVVQRLTAVHPTFGICLVLLRTIGLPFLVLATSSPLLQRWFAELGEKDPYHLYAASNAGSFVALLGYPLVLEPLLPVRGQARALHTGFAVYTLFAIVCAIGTLRRPAAIRVDQTPAPPQVRVSQNEREPQARDAEGSLAAAHQLDRARVRAVEPAPRRDRIRHDRRRERSAALGPAARALSTLVHLRLREAAGHQAVHVLARHGAHRRDHGRDHARRRARPRVPRHRRTHAPPLFRERRVPSRPRGAPAARVAADGVLPLDVDRRRPRRRVQRAPRAVALRRSLRVSDRDRDGVPRPGVARTQRRWSRRQADPLALRRQRRRARPQRRRGDLRARQARRRAAPRRERQLRLDVRRAAGVRVRVVDETGSLRGRDRRAPCRGNEPRLRLRVDDLGRSRLLRRPQSDGRQRPSLPSARVGQHDARQAGARPRRVARSARVLPPERTRPATSSDRCRRGRRSSRRGGSA